MMYNERFKAGKYDTKVFDREFKMTSWLNENSESLEVVSVYTSIKPGYTTTPNFHVLYKRVIGTDGEKIKKKVMI